MTVFSTAPLGRFSEIVLPGPTVASSLGVTGFGGGGVAVAYPTMNVRRIDVECGSQKIV